jgi:hypothetical protein
MAASTGRSRLRIRIRGLAEVVVGDTNGKF